MTALRILLCGVVVFFANTAWASEPLHLAMKDARVWPLDTALVPDRWVDEVVVRKSDRLLLLMRNGRPVRVYPVALGDDPVGHKQFEGDERTPEGSYLLDWRNPNSRFHKSIHVSYPNDQDRAYAEEVGRSPGGMIMIHGWPQEGSPEWEADRLRYRDWTDGCIAVSNTAMDEIWEWVEDGTPITIYP